jgi:hypothetical protein
MTPYALLAPVSTYTNKLLAYGDPSIPIIMAFITSGLLSATLRKIPGGLSDPESTFLDNLLGDIIKNSARTKFSISLAKDSWGGDLGPGESI